MRKCTLVILLIAVVMVLMGLFPGMTGAAGSLLTGPFQWKTGEPVVTPRNLLGDTTYSVKDPSIVRYDGNWHLFCTIRGKERSHATVYLSFRAWKDADKRIAELRNKIEEFIAQANEDAKNELEKLESELQSLHEEQKYADVIARFNAFAEHNQHNEAGSMAKEKGRR